MKSIKLNGEKHYLPALSELTFAEFDRAIVKEGVTDLKEYIALFTKIPIDELMNAELSGASLPALHASIFNMNIEEVIKDKKATIKVGDKTIAVSSLTHATFGKNYTFDLYHSAYKRETISFYSLCVYALAIAVTDSNDMKEIGEKHEELSKQVWTKVLPQGFFLAKKYSTNKANSIRLWVTCTLQSKAIRWKMKTSKMKLIIREKI